MPPEKAIFDAAVKNQSHCDEAGFIRSLMALGILHYYKYDKACSIDERNEQTEVRAHSVFLQNIADGFTDRQISDFYRLAEQQLDDYAWRKSRHVETKPWQVFWSGVAQSAAGAFLYSLIIVAAFIVIKYSSGDLLGVMKELFR